LIGGIDIDTKYRPIEWLGNSVRILDQTQLPLREVYIETSDFMEVASAIRNMKIRGAPAIGVAAAFGIALGALSVSSNVNATYHIQLSKIIDIIRNTRPTARNLFYTVERMNNLVSKIGEYSSLKKAIVQEALNIQNEEIKYSFNICQFGADLIQDGMNILTHCNTGPLATTGYGTALGIIKFAHYQKKNIMVFVDETRPLFQGSRLTVWELKKEGIPFSLITDSMAGAVMYQNKINLVIVGADCIAANGDTANKIGTYSLAVLSKIHGIPFIVAAPTSTIDISRKNGKDIIIEERNADEIIKYRGIPISLEDIKVYNPAFDVTPAKYISAIVTERGIIRKPSRKNVLEIMMNNN